jgi:hypothetical protein
MGLGLTGLIPIPPQAGLGGVGGHHDWGRGEEWGSAVWSSISPEGHLEWLALISR